jgi:hypothetical protein
VKTQKHPLHSAVSGRRFERTQREDEKEQKQNDTKGKRASETAEQNKQTEIQKHTHTHRHNNSDKDDNYKGLQETTVGENIISALAEPFFSVFVFSFFFRLRNIQIMSLTIVFSKYIL